MPTHWTYRAIDPAEDLSQGDIIARTERVLAILRDVHAHFCDEKYLSFIVLTQSCDLVIRGGRCKARHVCLAVVRALDGVLPDMLSELSTVGAVGVYTQESRGEATQLLQRIINQNEQAHGLFYLHPDADVGIAVPSVALLRVTISLRAKEHYEVLKAARSGSLDTEFRNKLGWLAGNLYSRVDTTDWADKPNGAAESARLIKDLLDGTGLVERNVWVPEAWVKSARGKVDLATVPRNAVVSTLQSYAPKPPQEIAVGRVRARAEQILKELNDKQVARLHELLEADQTFFVLAGHRVFTNAVAAFGADGAAAMLPLLGSLPEGAQFRGSLLGQFSQATRAFRQRQGPREPQALYDILRATPLLGDAAIDAARQMAGRDDDGSPHDQTAQWIAALKEEKVDGVFLERIRGLAHQVLNEFLSEKLTSRLENDQAFRAVLKGA